MNLLRKYLALRRLKASMRPDPQYQDRRLAQFTPDRRERYFENVRKALG